MIILFNGRIGLPIANQPIHTALAVEEKRIVAVGQDADVLNLASPTSQQINLNGQTVWPGLTDSHLHMEMFSFNLQLIQCETPTRDECLQRVAKKSASLPSGVWILGHGWNQNVWQGAFGSAAELDAISGDHPAFLSDKSLHSAWVNSRSLQLAGINRNTPDPEGGIIQRDKSGLPTGILFESAVRLIEQIIPSPTKEERLQAFLKGQAELLRFGLTGINDFDSLTSYEALRALQEQGVLKLRITKSIPFEKLDWAINQGIQTGLGDEFLRWGSLKLFADGALGPQTAAMLRPYEGGDTNLGKLQLNADDVFETGMKASPHGISLAIHAIGDRAIHEVLNGFGMLRRFERRNHLPVLNHRIEHLQLLHRDNLRKTAELGLTASMQPIHTTSDMNTADFYWGERTKYAYAFKTLLNNQTHLVFGSDAPVECPNPFWGLHAAITRRRQDGSPSEDGWNPQERITLNQAFAAYTSNAAKLSGFEVGQLIPGKQADLIIFSHDPSIMNSQELFTVLPEKCMVAGAWVF